MGLLEGPPHLSSGWSTLALLPPSESPPPARPPRPPPSMMLKCLQPARPASRPRNTEPDRDRVPGGAKRRAATAQSEGGEGMPAAPALVPASCPGPAVPALAPASSSPSRPRPPDASDAATSPAVGVGVGERGGRAVGACMGGWGMHGVGRWGTVGGGEGGGGMAEWGEGGREEGWEWAVGKGERAGNEGRAVRDGEWGWAADLSNLYVGGNTDEMRAKESGGRWLPRMVRGCEEGGARGQAGVPRPGSGVGSLP